MRNLFNFIIRHYFIFLFILLQVVSLLLIIQNHHYQRSFIVNSSNFIAGNIYNTRANIVQYFSLASENRSLAEANSYLHRYMNGTHLKTDQQVFTFRDTLYQVQFSYVNARVISNSVISRNNYITLNKGRLHGVRPDMGIITHNGVIGIIKDVSNNFSSALSFLHSDVQISAKIKKNNHMGTIVWEGYDYRKASMLYIPTHLELEAGDTIITSGFSHIFPEGVFIGTISDFEIRRGDNFFTIEVDLACDFNNIDNVQIVRNIFREEQLELETLSRTPIR
jgi:rod shape-determining protein MreC